MGEKSAETQKKKKGKTTGKNGVVGSCGERAGLIASVLKEK